jgi:predicted nucleotidyltransferase component of viral defense system
MTINIQLKIDVTTGDRITPKEIEYNYKLLFNDKSISIMAYNLETILAEKIETVLSRDVVNTRPRDFYDLYILYKQRGFEIDYVILKNALDETSSKRGSKHLISEYKSIINRVESNQSMNNFWLDYQKDFNYAKNITFNQTCEAILKILDATLT